MEIVDRILDLMDSTSITAAQLTREVPLTNGVITQWKQGKQKPSLDAIVKLSRYFKVSTDYLLIGKEDELGLAPNNKDFRGVFLIERITKLLEDRGVSAFKLTSELGLSNSAITDWKKGKAKPSTDAVIKIAQYFNVSTDYLLTGKESNIKNEKENIKVNDTIMNEKILRFSNLPIHEKFITLRQELGFSIDEAKTEFEKYGSFFDYSDYYESQEFTNHFMEFKDGFDSNDKKLFIQFLGEPSLFIRTTNKDAEKIKRTDIGLRIEERRKEKRGGQGISQEELANLLNVNVISVMSWESGERIPIWRCMELLDGALDLGERIMKKYEPDAAAFKIAARDGANEMKMNQAEREALAKAAEVAKSDGSDNTI